MANIEHGTLGYAEAHVPHFAEYANKTAREAVSGLVTGDDYKIALQTNDKTLWLLSDYSGPTWVSVSGIPSGTIMLFGQNSAPTGWTRKTNWQNNAMLCYAASGNIASGGAVNPQSVHAHGVGTYQFQTMKKNASILYGFSSGGGDVIMDNASGVGSADDGVNSLYWPPTGATTCYTKSGTGSSANNSVPYYQEVIAATKD